jgi:predicted HicB family RNase H-like nuclease
MAKTRSEINYAYAKKAYDDIRLQVKKGKKDIIKAHAAKNGESLNGYINRLIRESIGKEYGD